MKINIFIEYAGKLVACLACFLPELVKLQLNNVLPILSSKFHCLIGALVKLNHFSLPISTNLAFLEIGLLPQIQSIFLWQGH